MYKSKDLETQLMHLMMEKTQLQAEYARMPALAGKTIAERRRKQYAEQRLDQIDIEASQIRLHIKRTHAK